MKDIEALEKVQRRATRLIPCIHDKSYEDRLKMPNLFKLRKKRQRGDLIEAFKYINPSHFADCHWDADVSNNFCLPIYILQKTVM